MNLYFAGPLFTLAEQQFNKNLANKLVGVGYNVYLPQDMCVGLTKPNDIFNKCIVGVDTCDAVFAILDGSDADSGTCFEVGYAYANDIPIFCLRTDFRGSGDHLGLNLMLTESCEHLIQATFDPNYTRPGFTRLDVGQDPFDTIVRVLEPYKRLFRDNKGRFLLD
jgi:nucleoside 2-deoxyribosyltransferase